MLEQSIHRLIDRPLLSLPPEALLADAISMMDEHHISCVLICQHHKPLGIVTDRDLTHLIGRNAIHTGMRVSEVMAHPVISIHDCSSYFDVMEYFREHRIRHLALLNEVGEVSGIVTETDVINTLETIELLASIPVSDVMSDKVVVSLSPASSLREAIDQMDQLNIGSIVVVDQNKPVGILTESDIPHLLDQGVDLDVRVESAISSRIPVIEQRLTSFEALRMLRQEPRHHLVVVDDHGDIAGVLSRSDFTKGLIKRHIDSLQDRIEDQQSELHNTQLELADLRRREAEDKYFSLLNAATDAVISIDAQGLVIEFNPAAENIFGYAKADAIGKDLADLIIPASMQEKHRNSLKRYLVTGESTNIGKLIEVGAMRSDGTEVTIELAITPMHIEGTLRFTAFLRDITLRKQGEQKLTKRTRQLSHLVQASLRINAKLKIAKIMHALVDEGIHMVNAQSGAAGLYIEGCMQFHEYMTGSQSRPIDMNFEPGYGVPGWVIQHKRPYLSNDAEHDPHVIPEIQQQLKFYKLVDVPVLSRQGELLGCFEMHDRQDGCGFDAEDVEMLQALAATAAVAIENARMLKEVNRLNLVVEQVNDVVFYLDRDGCVQQINQAGERITGLSQAQIIGQPFMNFCAPEGLPVAQAMFKNKIRGKLDNLRYEIMALDACGNHHMMEVDTHPVMERGRFVGVYGIARDISERKQAELALTESEEKFRQLAENIGEVFWVTDPRKNTMLYISPAYESVWGRSRQSLYDSPKDWLTSIHSDDQQRILVAATEKQVSGTYDEEYRIVRPDGSIRWIRDRAFPVKNDSGEVYRVTGIAEDITRRIEAEREQKKLQRQMEHTQRLESLGVLAGGIAHDFNNILTAILGNAAMAERKGLANPQDARRYLANIVASSEKAADLCKQMLAYSGKGQFIIKALDLSAMVEEVAKLLEVSITKSIVLKYHLPENLPAVEADAAQLQQVIMNLVINASDAIGDQSGVISIATGVMQADRVCLSETCLDDQLAEGRYVYLEVSDTGCGMDKQTQAKIFEPFFTTKFTGHGLGMSAVLGIVRGHHGAIKLYSEPGHGSTFKMLLPISDQQAEAMPAQAQPTGAWRGSGAVLIVDDEETIRETAAMMLEDMGFATLAAVDGEDGVRVYRQHQGEIVAVLLDMTMPKMDGKTCFTELKRINPDVQVLLSSGYNEQEATSRFAGKGLAGFIQKPYLPETLEASLRQIIQKDIE